MTIAAVADDVAMVRLVIAAGADTALVTSPYQGTALIAAALDSSPLFPLPALSAG